MSAAAILHTAGAVLGLAALFATPGVRASDKPSRDWQQSRQEYGLPNVMLWRADGTARRLSLALNDGRPTVMTFMFSSCATVCPIVNQTLVGFEQLLGAERARVNTVSISIDPTNDSVQKLADHARRTGASGSFYTGDPGASEAVQRAFNVWRGGDKMAHRPVFLIRARPGSPWWRIDGLVSPAELLAVYRQALAAPAGPPGA